MAMPSTYAPTRRKWWERRAEPKPKHSVKVSCGDFTCGYERAERAPAAAIKAVEKHVRFLVSVGALPAGRWRLEIEGTTEQRLVSLARPRTR